LFQVFSFFQISPPCAYYVFVFFPLIYLFFLFSLNNRLTNFDSKLHFKLLILCIIHIYFLLGLCPSRSPCLNVTTQHSVIRKHVNIFSGIQTHIPSVSNVAKLYPFHIQYFSKRDDLQILNITHI
jgi:hypothetical protein